MTVLAHDASAGEADTSTPRRLGRRTVLRLAAGMIVLHLLYQGWALYRAWFHIDDFNFVSHMTNDGLGLASAAESYFGHVMPAGMYLSWLNNAIAPWQWGLPASELLALLLLADVGLVVLLVRLFGPRPGILAPLALFMVSAISMPVTIWWAAAINQIPLMVALFFALSAHTSYLRTGNLRHAWATTAWIVFGLAFNEKTILVYGAIVIFTLCYFTSGSLRERLRSLVRERWRGFLVYGVVAALYVAFYLRVGLGFSPGQRVDYPTYEVARNMLLKAYVPGVVGGPLQWWRIPDQPGSIPSPSDLVVLASLVVVGVVVRELALTRRRWARAALLPVFFLGTDIVLVLAGRASYVGALISLDYRYQGELAAVTAVALGCALFPILGAVQPVLHRSRSELLDVPRRATALMVVIAVLGTYSSSAYARHWHADHKSRTYVQGVTAALDRAKAPLPLVDLPVPPSITNGLRYPENLFSHVFRSYGDDTDYPVTATDHLYVVTEDGDVTPVVVPDTRSAPPGPTKHCGYRISGRSKTIDLDGPLAYGGWWVRIGYISTGGSPITVTTGDISHRTRVQPGLHALFVRGAGAFDSVTLSGLQGGAKLCTDDVTVGRPEPVVEDKS